MYICIHQCVLSHLQSCLALFDPTDCSLAASAVHGILQAGILEWCLPPGNLPNPGIEPLSLMSPALQVDSLPLATHLCAYTQRLILSDWLTEVGKSYTCRAGWQPGDPSRANVTVQIQSLLPPARRRMVFRSTQVFNSSDKAQPHNHSGGQLALLNIHSLNCESNPKIPHRNTQNDI